MQERHTEQDYRALLIADTPIIDVRAPIEFEHGAMPAAINLPLMNNDERAAVLGHVTLACRWFSANGLFPLSFPARIYFNPEGLFIFR